eukprot:jgi/Mesvir1/21366/Mv20850-RA.1
MVGKWKSDFDKFVVLQSFERLGWVRAHDDEDDWNIYWTNVFTAKNIFNPDNGIRLGEYQLVNHFPNHYELTRKDLMVKNIKRYKKEIAKDPSGSSGVDPAEIPEMIPATFTLPADYSLFAEEFRRNPSALWIIKPSNRAQGTGIFLINKLSQVRRFANDKGWLGPQGAPVATSGKDTYVASRYIDSPLLIGGRKFDLRLYVLVLSYRPLKAYLSSLGFARFCNEKYTCDVSEIDNALVHLTNVAIQKHGPDYNASHGNKLTLASLMLYIAAHFGQRSAARLDADIRALIVHTLRAVQGVMINDRHCFELYGYDVIIDDRLQPWIIETNASPSLSTTTADDRRLKFHVISDALRAITPPEWRHLHPARTPDGFAPRRAASAGGGNARGGKGAAGSSPQQVGSFSLLIDEAAEMEVEKARKEVEAAAGPPRKPVWGSRPATGTRSFS